MKKIAIDKSQTGWSQVTDIPCIVPGCPGLLRWAEAGYVPGYRICDCCGSHYALAAAGDIATGLHCVRRLRPTPAKIQKMHFAMGTAAKAAADFQVSWLRKMTEKANVRWAQIGEKSPHGNCVSIPWEDSQSASGCLIDEIQPPEFADLIRRCWVLTAQLRSVAGAQILYATRDGQHVMVYQATDTYGGWDGWWDVTALRDALAAGWLLPEKKMSAEQKESIGVFR